MNKHTCLTNHFLIAMPVMNDPNFFRAVAYICEHTEEGAVALFGCWSSACRKAVKPVVEAHDSLLIYPVQYCLLLVEE